MLLLFEFALHTINVNTLADFQDVLCVRCINDKYFAGLWDKHAAEDGCDDKYDWNVENYYARAIVSKDVRYSFGREYEEPIACVLISEYALHGVYIALLSWVRCVIVTWTQIPVRVVVDFFVLRFVPITVELEIIANVEGGVSREQGRSLGTRASPLQYWAICWNVRCFPTLFAINLVDEALNYRSVVFRRQLIARWPLCCAVSRPRAQEVVVYHTEDFLVLCIIQC